MPQQKQVAGPLLALCTATSVLIENRIPILLKICRLLDKIKINFSLLY